MTEYEAQMARPHPRDVFDNPALHWSFLTKPTDDEIEGQHFDRKEAGQPLPSGGISRSGLDGLRELVTKTVSAFANSNREGGLLVLGFPESPAGGRGLVIG